jgi:hypothetical protein
MIKNAIKIVWRRRHWLLPAGIVFVLLAAAPIIPALSPYALVYWLALCVGATGLIIAYLAVRMRNFVQRLTIGQRHQVERYSAMIQEVAIAKASAESTEQMFRAELKALRVTIRETGDIESGLAQVERRIMNRISGAKAEAQDLIERQSKLLATNIDREQKEALADLTASAESSRQLVRAELKSLQLRTRELGELSERLAEAEHRLNNRIDVISTDAKGLIERQTEALADSIDRAQKEWLSGERVLSETLDAYRAELSEGLDASRANFSEVRSQLDDLEKETRVADEGIENLNVEFERLSQALSSFEESTAEQFEQGRAAAESHQDDIKRIREDLEVTRTRDQEAVERLRHDIETADALLRSEIERVSEASGSTNEALADDIRRVREGLEQRMHAEIAEHLKVEEEKAVALADKVKTLEIAQNAETGFLRFNRALDYTHVHDLQTHWTKRLSVKFTPGSLYYTASRIRMLEQNSIGRLATQVEDAVLRTLVAASSGRGKTLNVLEIGSLFGIGLTMIHDFARQRYDRVHLTAIDPLEGYYDADSLDTLLQIPVNHDNFWNNMRMAGVPEEDVTLIDRFSTDDEAIKLAARKSYDVLIIDGDHTYGGVKADFDNYVGMVKRGGYIVVDDYHSEDWPDVTEFVDRELMDRNDISLVGIQWRTAIFRVVQRTAPARPKRVASKTATTKRRSKAKPASDLSA